MTSVLDKCKAFMIDLIFPNRCPFCGEFIRWDFYLCKACEDKLVRANKSICRKCGKSKCLCAENSCHRNYDAVFATFFYKDEKVRDAICGLKIDGETNIALAAADDTAKYIKSEGMKLPDAVVPVPMGKKKCFKRGHNQAEIFAKCFGKIFGIPVIKNALYKYDTKEEQHNNSREERERRVNYLFHAKNADLTGMTILLCDDVMTTGATLNRCALLLKNLGAEAVIVAACAVTELETTIG